MNNNTIIECGFRTYHLKNYGNIGGCYLPRPLDLHNFSDDTHPHSVIQLNEACKAWETSSSNALISTFNKH